MKNDRGIAVPLLLAVVFLALSIAFLFVTIEYKPEIDLMKANRKFFFSSVNEDKEYEKNVNNKPTYIPEYVPKEDTDLKKKVKQVYINEQPESELTVYKLEIVKESEDSNYYGYIWDFMETVLDIRHKRDFLTYYYYSDNTYKGSEINLDIDWYLLTHTDALEIGKEYSKDGFIVTPILENKNLVPFLLNPKYCEANSDCKIRNSFCSYGGYNEYNSLNIATGCLFSSSSNEGITAEQFESKAKELGCPVPHSGKGYNLPYLMKVTFTDVECSNNECRAESPIYECFE